MRKILLLPLLALAVLLLSPVTALAATSDAPPLATHELLTSTQFYAAVIGALVPGIAYLLNHYAPWCSDRVKALVLVLVAAAAGALTQVLDAGSLALDTNTLQVVGTAVFLAFLAHAGFWKPSGLAALLKAGTNRQGPALAGDMPVVVKLDGRTIAEVVAKQAHVANARAAQL